MKATLFLAEIFVFYLLLAFLNWTFFPHVLGFLDVDPHPFWAGVLLFGFRYGVAAGFTAGTVSSILYMASAWAAGERYRFEELNFYILPSFFLIFGVLIGIFTAKNRQALRELQGEREQSKREAALLKGEMDTLNEINRGLEKKVVTRMSTLITLYEGARRLEAVHVDELYPAILEFTTKTLGAEEASLYLKDEKGWSLAHQFGWKEYERRPRHVKPLEGITGMAGSAGKIVSLRDFAGKEKDLNEMPQFLGDAVMAGPLKGSRNGEVTGVISIQKMPFFNFNSATVNLFSFLLNWGSRSLEQARYVEALRAQEIIDPELQVYSARYFRTRLSQEFQRSRTYYLPLSLGVVRIPGLEFLPPRKKGPFLLLLSSLLRESCRDMDVVAILGEPTIPFSILWVTASDKQASEMRKKISDNFERLHLEEFEGKLSLEIGVSSFTPQTKDAESLLSMAKEALSRGDGERIAKNSG